MADIDAALAPLRARLSAARLIDAVGGGAHLPPSSSSSSPSSALPPPMDVAVLEHDQTVGDALYLLARRRVLSAPLVVDPAVARDDRAEELGFGPDDDDDDESAAAAAARPPALLGWIGLREVVMALHEHLAQAAEHSGKPLPTGMLALMTALHAESPKFLQRKLVTLKDADDSALVYQADQGAPLLTVVRDVFCCAPCGFGGGLGEKEDEEGEDEGMEEERPAAAAAARAPADAAAPAPPTAPAYPPLPPHLAPEAAQTKEQRQQQRQRRRRRRRGAHRLAVFDALGRLTHVVSQLDVVRFLHARCADELAAASALSLRQLGLHPPRPGAPLVTLQPHTPTLFALERMVREGVNGAAVVGPGGGGEIVANLSLSDCRCMQGAKDLAALALPVAEFLALSHGTSYLGYSAGARRGGGGIGGGGQPRPGGGGGGRGATTMPPPSAGTPPTFFAAAARAAAARNGGGGATPPDMFARASSLSSTPPPASPAFGAGGSPRVFGGGVGGGTAAAAGGAAAAAAGGSGGAAGAAGAAAATTGATPPKLVRLSSGGISSAGGCGYPAPAGVAVAAPQGGGNGAAAAHAAHAAPHPPNPLHRESSASLTAEEAAVADEADHVVRLITADPDRATLADVVALMARHHVHRVFLLEREAGGAAAAANGGVSRTAMVPAAGAGGAAAGAGRVTGVVTPTDLLELLAGKVQQA